MSKHRHKKIFHSRLLLVGSIIILQAVVLMLAIWAFNNYFVYFFTGCILLSAIEVFIVINKDYNPAYKLAICIPILLFPIFGGLFYLFLGNSHLSRKQKRDMINTQKMQNSIVFQDKEVYEDIRRQSRQIGNQVKYVFDICGYPIYSNTSTHYLRTGEEFFEELKKSLRQAQRYIFMEYFIINEGRMWSEILEILKEKAKEGLDVRLIYDDVGCIDRLPYGYENELLSYGIRCKVFNRLTPIVSMWHNNRDHRKITVIDGEIAFTGGTNLSDEYINEYELYGNWRDASIIIKGEAVWSFTFMFLSFWKSIGAYEQIDYKKFKSSKDFSKYKDGYVLPYGDSPIDKETLGENIYLNIISKAERFIYICTPYFVVDNETLTAICLAAKCGLDVRIITPHIEDKWYVHMITRSYYKQLIRAGVKVYEYTPGFIHSKTIIADGNLGVVGTINFDFRSMYLHFECAVLMYKCKAVKELEEDFISIMGVSQEMSIDECKKEKPHTILLRMILRLISPLL